MTIPRYLVAPILDDNYDSVDELFPLFETDDLEAAAGAAVQCDTTGQEEYPFGVGILDREADLVVPTREEPRT